MPSGIFADRLTTLRISEQPYGIDKDNLSYLLEQSPRLRRVLFSNIEERPGADPNERPPISLHELEHLEVQDLSGNCFAQLLESIDAPNLRTFRAEGFGECWDSPDFVNNTDHNHNEPNSEERLLEHLHRTVSVTAHLLMVGCELTSLFIKVSE